MESVRRLFNSEFKAEAIKLISGRDISSSNLSQLRY